MYSIKESVENTLVIKKSKFITKLYKINHVEEIENYLSLLRREYKDATHICYAYIVNKSEKCFDDGEPSGTAGIPILNILKKNNVENVLAIVIRYFGGIKLGAGGLVRAYSNSIVEAFKLTTIVTMIEGYNIEIKFDYNNIKKIDLLLKDVSIINKSYNQDIIYDILISKEKFLSLKTELINICLDLNIKENILISN